MILLIVTRQKERSSSAAHLNSSVAGAHHPSTGGMHLGQVVEGQDVARLCGQVEKFKCLLVITLYTNAVCEENKENDSKSNRKGK